MIQVKKILKRLALTLIFIFASVLLIIQIPVLNTSLSQSIINYFLPANQTILISKIQGSFPFDIKIQTVDFFDEKGKWGSLEELEYSWRGINLLFGNLHLDRLALKSAQFFRLPSLISKDSSVETPQPSFKGIPEKIPHINIDRFHIEKLIMPSDFLTGKKNILSIGRAFFRLL